MSDATYSVNGIAPARAAAPATREEAAELIRKAAAEGWAIVPYGGGTQIDLGCPPARLDLVLSTERLNRVVDYQPDDMTVTVEPGITLAELERVLSGRGQFLPLNPPLPDRATVGGMVAAASSGPWRAAYGTPRDWVIGCRVVGADGQEVRGGGQVVKNVAGYDLPKLYTGSFGTLGLITEVTFKVMPRPPASGCCRVTLDSADATEALLRSAMDSDLQPAALELILRPETEEGETLSWSLLFQFLHFPEAVEWQIRHLLDLAKTAGARAEQLPAEVGDPLLRSLRDLPAQAPFVARIGTVSSRVAETATQAAGLSRLYAHEPAIRAHAATGQVYVYASAEVDSAFAGELRALATAQNASCRFPRLPPALVGQVEPWGEVGPELRLMRGIKQALDPGSLFSPGRFAGRL